MLSASRKIKDDGNIIFMDEARTARESMDGPSMARLRDALLWTSLGISCF